MPILRIAVLVAVAVSQESKPIPGIGPAGEIVKLHTGFKFTEGPAADAQGNVYFSDIPNNRIHKVGLDGKLSTFLENSEGANGLMFDAKGRLLACQGKAGRIAAVDPATAAVTPLTEKYAEKGAPNDIVIDREGGVYFTDPGESSVYYVPAGGKVASVLTGLPRPNGVILSPDGKTLGFIAFPEGPANCTFGGKDLKTLYVTARTSLYTVAMEATGHRFAAGK